jgi:hypothetical protein
MTKPPLETRLSALPPKVSHPLRALRDAGQIDNDFLDLLLTAAGLSGDTNRLLGFAAGFLHMTNHRIPVHDVIRMALDQNRRINLAWSPARWTAEHNKLSRAETLSRLQDTDVTYDLQAYEPHLSPAGRAALIRTSRRLGLEGLRQRHCVASYHGRILSGQCAIASMIIDRQRWTVELTLAKSSENPVIISQIKTRYNGHASPLIRSQIHAAFGIPQNAATPEASNPPNALYLENLRRVLPVLSTHDVESVVVTFSGSGDSGCIDTIYYQPPLRAQIGPCPVEHLTCKSIYDGQWRTDIVTEVAPLDQALEELTMSYLDETGVNWYDGEGGYGELVIDVRDRSVSLEINVNYSQATTEYDRTRSIDSGEDTP